MFAWAKLARRARDATQLTQAKFAKTVGANRATIAAWEAGLRQPSRLALSMLCLIAQDGPDALRVLKRCHGALDRMVSRGPSRR